MHNLKVMHLCMNVPFFSQQDVDPMNDPHLWLEEIEGDKALAWVTDENQRTIKRLTDDSRFQDIY
ncbi:MAG: hypothetical protein JRH15_11800 [Deltaproteobacteria bacterium]|nr:hypothetical protein [Deltaproteobacteria bacterium]